MIMMFEYIQGWVASGSWRTPVRSFDTSGFLYKIHLTSMRTLRYEHGIIWCSESVILALAPVLPTSSELRRGRTARSRRSIGWRWLCSGPMQKGSRCLFLRPTCRQTLSDAGAGSLFGTAQSNRPSHLVALAMI